MGVRIFIDGDAGTTALGIRERLQHASGIEILSIDPTMRKDKGTRRAMLERADIAVLCLPDEAARETVALGEGLSVRFLDASTAHRVDQGWAYGLPELCTDQAEAIHNARCVSNPGCYATGAIALLRPLVTAGIMPVDFPVSINAVSGYTGGGRAMIEAHERDGGPGFMLYGLDLHHKHLPEITHYSGLSRRPLFVPSVGHFPQGMIVSIPLHLVQLHGCPDPADLRRILQDAYRGSKTIRVVAAENTLTADGLVGQDGMELRVHGQEGQVVLTARLDNLGKGACGAAVRNLMLMIGQEKAAAEKRKKQGR